MKSLFLKIFLSYWMAQALFLALAILITLAMRERGESAIWDAQHPFRDVHGAGLRMILDSLPEWILRRWRQIFVISFQPQPLRSIPRRGVGRYGRFWQGRSPHKTAVIPFPSVRV